MTRAEALAIANLWHGWNPDREVTNRIYREFVYSVVAGHRLLRHLNCFEVLDAVTNETAWRALGQPVPVRAQSAGTSVVGALSAAGSLSAAGAAPSNAAEHRAGGQAASARVVEIEEAAY
jgi:hypothetical protein